MWAGFGVAAAKKLELLKVHLTKTEIRHAARALAAWYASVGEYDRALDHLKMRRLAYRHAGAEREQLVLEVEVLLKLGRVKDALEIIDDGLANLGEIPELCYAAANAAALNAELSDLTRDHLRLRWLSKPFVSAGLSSIRLKNDAARLALDNIAGSSVTHHPRSHEAKISVLMPAHSAESTIDMAIESVLSQT
jgi:hypothetical protein